MLFHWMFVLKEFEIKKTKLYKIINRFKYVYKYYLDPFCLQIKFYRLQIKLLKCHQLN